MTLTRWQRGFTITCEAQSDVILLHSKHPGRRKIVRRIFLFAVSADQTSGKARGTRTAGKALPVGGSSPEEDAQTAAAGAEPALQKRRHVKCFGLFGINASGVAYREPPRLQYTRVPSFAVLANMSLLDSCLKKKNYGTYNMHPGQWTQCPKKQTNTTNVHPCSSVWTRSCSQHKGKVQVHATPSNSEQWWRATGNSRARVVVRARRRLG